MNLTLFYTVIAAMFIVSIKMLSSPQTAVRGAILGALGMILAIFSDFAEVEHNHWEVIAVLAAGALTGIFIGLKIKITELAQMVAVLNGLGGLAAVCISLGETIKNLEVSWAIAAGVVAGGLAFSGSMIAFLKLQGIRIPYLQFKGAYMTVNFLMFILTLLLATGVCFCTSNSLFLALVFSSLLWGVVLVMPIGGADMPIVISLLNSFSGWATVMIGFAQSNILLISVGSLVGIGGVVLAYIMIKSMNLSFAKLFSRKMVVNTSSADISRLPQTGSPQDAAFVMKNAKKVIIVPGFGMAAASAQHALKNMGEILKNKYGVEVKYAIHPVAGRMPGHMNVLLAEADVSYNDIFGFEDIEREFELCDAAYVIGANDITNPKAKTDVSSPLYGMPVFDVGAAKSVFFVKRTAGAGYSGVENPLFFEPNTFMLYGDAKKVTEEVNKFLDE
ncbi:MAG: NAD(P)(+) transhydrogenase (Re/Si-specific) subunit beta [Alphaproteobacteria bacterium]|nr:NAD(P)(+) transhydrogenase (Re/Si-specific) subunit beta [Alphaproteobacteria bacterium]